MEKKNNNVEEFTHDYDPFEEDGVELEDLEQDEEVEGETDIIEFECKPTYNFQSVTFKYKGSLESIGSMMVIYEMVLDELKRIAPDQPNQVSSAPAGEPATAKQLEILDSHGIAYPKNCTKQQAFALIKKSMSK